MALTHWHGDAQDYRERNYVPLSHVWLVGNLSVVLVVINGIRILWAWRPVHEITILLLLNSRRQCAVFALSCFNVKPYTLWWLKLATSVAKIVSLYVTASTETLKNIQNIHISPVPDRSCCYAWSGMNSRTAICIQNNALGFIGMLLNLILMRGLFLFYPNCVQ